jgi:aromatic ring-opening dioxygenase catalytic subunit (LigB family)
MKSSGENKIQVVFFGHGGGPLPILGDPSHKSMIDFLTRLPAQLKKPDAIIVISAHWEESKPTLLGAKNPPMFYDYYGFPDEAYAIQYPAPGEPAMAGKVAELLINNGIPAQVNPHRGFDHGVFIPLKMMYPDADIPCTQLSLLRGLDAAQHINLGKALRELHTNSILVVGSGFSFHNMSAFNWGNEDLPDQANDAFQEWLIETCAGSLSFDEMEKCLAEWEKAPSARYCHPREEHLLPLLVCAGLAGGPGKLVFDDRILGKRNVGFLWQ